MGERERSAIGSTQIASWRNSCCKRLVRSSSDLSTILLGFMTSVWTTRRTLRTSWSKTWNSLRPFWQERQHRQKSPQESAQEGRTQEGRKEEKEGQEGPGLGRECQRKAIQGQEEEKARQEKGQEHHQRLRRRLLLLLRQQQRPC